MRFDPGTMRSQATFTNYYKVNHNPFNTDPDQKLQQKTDSGILTDACRND